MLEIIATLVFLASLSGIVIIFLRKAPLLANLPKTTSVFEVRKSFIQTALSRTQEWLKNRPPFKDFSPEIFLQKILSKTRVLMLRLESKTAGWLEILRKKSQEKNDQKKETDDYWQGLQKKEQGGPR